MKPLLLHAFALLVAFETCVCLTCYYCEDPCDVSEAKNVTCGLHIAKSRHAVCTKSRPEDSGTPRTALRRCEVFAKDERPSCPANYMCDECEEDWCNAAPPIRTCAQLVLAWLFTEFLIY